MKKKKRKRKIEVFVSMCQICFDAIDLVNDLAGPDDEVTILDVERSIVADRAGTRYSLYSLCGD